MSFTSTKKRRKIKNCIRLADKRKKRWFIFINIVNNFFLPLLCKSPTYPNSYSTSTIETKRKIYQVEGISMESRRRRQRRARRLLKETANSFGARCHCWNDRRKSIAWRFVMFYDIRLKIRDEGFLSHYFCPNCPNTQKYQNRWERTAK